MDESHEFIRMDLVSVVVASWVLDILENQACFSISIELDNFITAYFNLYPLVVEPLSGGNSLDVDVEVRWFWSGDLHFLATWVERDYSACVWGEDIVEVFVQSPLVDRADSTPGTDQPIHIVESHPAACTAVLH